VRLNHVLVYVADVGRSLAFYENKLGFVRIEGSGEEGYARLRAPDGEATLGLHQGSGESDVPKHEGIRLYIEIEDLDTACRKLEDQGVVFDQRPQDMPWGWRHAYLRDPDGFELSLYWAGGMRYLPTPKPPGR
jgi:catechol 2,3-dioxygenase-like lactoylglutathione lyase family enzyme